jgi:hypothetical protein
MGRTEFTNRSTFDSVHLPAHEFAELCALAEKSGPKDRRRDVRFNPGGRLVLLMQVESPGTHQVHWRVQPRDVSAGGVGFFHRGYLHPGTRLSFAAQRPDGTPLLFRGEVMWCRFLRSNVHDVGVKLADPIDAAGLCEAVNAGGADSPGGGQVDYAEVERLADQLRSQAAVRSPVLTLRKTAAELAALLQKRTD